MALGRGGPGRGMRLRWSGRCNTTGLQVLRRRPSARSHTNASGARARLTAPVAVPSKEHTML
eukprot:354463-Chlamydomonas_euryale.AAC.13